MSMFKAGIVCLVLALAASAFGQISGEVESIGLGGLYRQECWTPMLVRIAPGADDSGEYQIQITQEDMDRDRAVYTRTIAVTGGAREQRFWCYFLPQPTKNVLNGRGLPDTSQGGNLANLQEQLKVYLCDAKGKQLARLPVTSTVTNIEPTLPGQNQRGVKMVVFVTDGRSQPVYREYADMIGTSENVEFVTIQPRDLPEDVRGLEAVDAVVWAGAPPPDPAVPAEEPRMRALQRWVWSGGKLVICQPAEWQRALVWGDLLPVTFPKIGDVQGVARKDDLYPLRALARAGTGAADPWNQPKGPFYFGVADAKADSRVDDDCWIDWKGGPAGMPARTPYLVRRAYNLGETIWVAQDLGDPAITARARSGWAYVWDKVFDWKNDLKLVTANTSEAEKLPYAPAAGVDMGYTILEGIRLSSTIAWLVGVAVTFFIGYWLLAGPGVYLYLLKVRRTGMSWIGFALAAVAATAVTLLVVRLVLRGAPEMRHVTLVKAGPSGPAVAMSKVSLYVKRDGLQAIELQQTASDAVSYVSPLKISPSQLSDQSEFAANLQYTVPVREPGASEPPGASIPYRSTEKKLDVRWVGEMAGRITGAPALAPQTRQAIKGVLTNGTGQNLRDVWIAFSAPRSFSTEGSQDYLLYYPRWDDGTNIDLVKDYPDAMIDTDTSNDHFGKPEDGKRLYGNLGIQGTQWSLYFDSKTPRPGGVMGDSKVEDWGQMGLHVFPQLSLFERLRPVKNTFTNTFRPKDDRFERLRRGARGWDVSQVVAGGGLVVLAESQDDVPLPYPMTVDGDVVAGKGTVFYQFALPLDRSALEEAQARAATQPTAGAGEGDASVVGSGKSASTGSN